VTAPLPQHPHRLVYLGTPQLAVPPLRALVAAGHEVALVVSQPDRKRGRGGALQPSPVKAAAIELGLPVTDRVDDVLDVGADAGVVVAFGRLIKPHVLDVLPMVNIHFSLLPRWRGAAPVERAILAGDERTGVCLMEVDESLDTGAVLARVELHIDPDEQLDELRDRLVAVGTDLLVDGLASGLGPSEPQVGDVTYAEKIQPEELHLDWARPAAELHRVTRLGEAWTTFRGHRFKVRRARLSEAAGTDLAPGELGGVCVGAGDGVVELVEVQPEGKVRQQASDWVRGARLQPGERLGE
jgi:methionyl-tRNA formyltransferase